MNSFDVKARVRERTFIKQIKAGTTFRTGAGRQNVIVSVQGNVIYLQTAKSKRPFKLKREQLRAGIKYMLQERTATRRDLQKAHKYSSALMGLLQLVFAGISRIKRTIRGLLRITLSDIRHIFSGLSRSPSDMKMVKEHGGVEVLVSYWEVRHDRNAWWSYHAHEHGLRVLLDSGEYSRYAAAKRGKPTDPIDIEEYAAFIQKHKDALSGWINLDVIGDPKTSRRNEAYLADMGLQPIPVYHCQSPLTVLAEMVRANKYPVIAIGGSVFISESKRKECFERIHRDFPNQAFHLLGGTSQMVREFPWFSVDSSTYLIGRKFRKLVTPAGQCKAPDDWSSEECLAANIRELSGMEGNYSRQFAFPLLVRPTLSHDESWSQLSLGIV